MSRQSILALSQKHYQDAFERNVERIQFEIAMGTPRRHLDVLLELLRVLIPGCGDSQLTASYTERLARLERVVGCRHNLRLVSGKESKR